MIKITFPDNSVKEYAEGTTPLQIAESISSRLAQEVLVAAVNGESWDLMRPIQTDSAIQLFKWEDEEGKHAFWHSSAHLMAEALQELYPGIKFGIGPAVENGFYYDVDPGETVIKDADFPVIEAKMKELAAKKEEIKRQDISKADALNMFGERGEVYKTELISELEDVKDQCGDEVEMGQINNYTVHMILAKMYLNHNAWFNNHSDNSYYQRCIDELNVIINSGKFSLAPNYSDNFREDISTSPEIIFGIPFEYLYAGGNYYANKWMNEAGRATWGFTGWATGGSAAIPQFLDTYDEDDTRFEDCWIGGVQKDINGQTIYVDGQPLNYTYEIRSTDNPGCYPMEGYRLVKYEILEGDWGTSYDDVPFFRYADVLMMKAECLLRLGGYNGETEQDAADLVTQVRQRAFKDNPEKATRTVAQLKGGSVYQYGHRENTAQQDEPDNWIITEEGGDDIELGGLLDDLAWEFVAEHHRRQDLIRFRMTNGQNVFNGKSWFCKDAVTDPTDNHCDIFPIHKTFLDGNINLKQNPGYGG